MVIELGMVSVLTGMGVYFVKSTDLPKDLKNRSEQMKVQGSYQSTQFKPKFNFDNLQKKSIAKEEEKLFASTEIELQKKLEIQLKQEKEINLLTLKITTLEQEIRDNNKRNAEILLEIDAYLVQLENLNKQRIS